MNRPPATSIKPSRALLTLVAVAGLGLLSACSRDAGLNFLHPEGPVARDADKLWRLTFTIASVIFVIVEGILVFAIFRFKERSKNAMPRQVHGNTKAEIGWTLAPALILAIIAVPTVGGIFTLSQKPPDPLEITVVGHQWWWEIKYTESGVVTAGQMHVPTNRPVYVTLESTDVIHSFWVPKLAGKQDVVPGRRNKMYFTAERPETYLGQCVEFCGISHANMRFRVVSMEPGDFEDWLSDQQASAALPAGGLAAEGAEIFQEAGCAGCHAIAGTPAQGLVGPNLTHFASRQGFAGFMFERNDENLRQWLKDPPARKPGAKMPDLGLTDDQIEALVAYLNTLE